MDSASMTSANVSLKRVPFFCQVKNQSASTLQDRLYNFVELFFRCGNRTYFLASSKTNVIQGVSFHVSPASKLMKVVMVVCAIAAVVLKRVDPVVLPAVLFAVKLYYRWQYDIKVPEGLGSLAINPPLPSVSAKGTEKIDPIPTTSIDIMLQPDQKAAHKTVVDILDGLCRLVRVKITVGSDRKPLPNQAAILMSLIKQAHGQETLRDFCGAEEGQGFLTQAKIIEGNRSGRLTPYAIDVIKRVTTYEPGEDRPVSFVNPYPGKVILRWDGYLCPVVKGKKTISGGIEELSSGLRLELIDICEQSKTSKVRVSVKEKNELLQKLKEFEWIVDGEFVDEDIVNYVNVALFKGRNEGETVHCATLAPIWPPQEISKELEAFIKAYTSRD
jgi:hypothetical protein